MDRLKLEVKRSKSDEIKIQTKDEKKEIEQNIMAMCKSGIKTDGCSLCSKLCTYRIKC